MAIEKNMSNAADVAFRTIEKKANRKAGRKAKALPFIHGDKLLRCKHFVDAIDKASVDLVLYKTTTGAERFTIDKAKEIGSALRSTMKAIGAHGIALKILPVGRTDAGTVEYGIAGYKTRSRVAPDYSAL